MNTEEETLQDQQPGRRMRLGDQAERSRFEQYRGGDFERDAQGYYTNPRTAQDWAIWQAALSAQPSPGGQDAHEMADALERIASGSLSDYEGVDADELHILRCAKLIRDLSARQPVGEHAEGDEFLAGVCVALQCVTAQDSGVLWAEIVRAVGVDDLLQYATFIEPAEWDLAGFSTYASTELNRRRPRSKAAKQATRPPPQAVDHQAALLAEERAHGNTIDQRDRCEEVADELAARIASITGVDIGEHSSANCPWHNAIEAAEAYQPEQVVDPDELRRAISVVNVVGRVDGHDVVRRDSVLDVIDTRRQRLTDSKVVGNG
ncbi:hypothetical protein [Stenotrophomonas maltophilia]|uniref:hypothetical protein n=1 Tax=Stenotrophomonas maltophilia TaxID=40324 RepID=UPI001595BDFC|nr:hypothetical protein [Stenotrophomonas maltophilia]